MANGTDSNELVAKVKGKRELMWAVQTQADGRKPNRKRQKKTTANKEPNRKRQKKALRKDDEKLGEICEGENVVEESEDAESDVVDVGVVSDEDPKSSHGCGSESESKGRELKNGVVEIAIDNNESNSVAVDDESNSAAGEESKKKTTPPPLKQYTRSPRKKTPPPLKQYTRSPRKTRAHLRNNVVDVAVDKKDLGVVGDGQDLVQDGRKVEGEVVEKHQRRRALQPESNVADLTVAKDKLEITVQDMAIDNEPSVGCIGDEPRQELDKSETKKALVIENGDKMDGTVVEKPQSHVDVEPRIGDLVNSDECMQEDLDKPFPIDLQDLIENGHKVEREVVEKPMRRFTRSLLKPNVENMVISDDFDSDSNRIPLDTQPMKLGMKMTNKNGKKFTTLSDLFQTGILDGQSVTYIKRSKGRNPAVEGLTGVITGDGILCHCKECNGKAVVLPPTFEYHASSTNRRPPDYIYLGNGKTLRDVLTACCSSLETVEEAVRLAVGSSSIKTCKICLNCKESICRDETKSAMLLCDSCLALKDIQAKPSVDLKPSTSANPSLAVKDNFESLKLITVSKCSDNVSSCRDKISKCTDIVLKTPDNVVKQSLSGSKSRGRVTKKDLGMHKLVFEEGILPDRAEVTYVYNGQKLLTGYIKGSGIVCSHCEQEVSPSQFEAHAGFESRRKPYHGIFTSNGVSLHELALRLSKTRDLSTKARDDLCQICQVGGNLMGCNNCPRVYHAECLTLPTAPTGTWYCMKCQIMFDKDVDVEHNANAVAAGRISGVDPIEQITNRCIRIVTSFEEKLGGCVVCRGHDFGQGKFGPDTVLICDQCEREFHVRCLFHDTIEGLKEVQKEKWFCDNATCLRINKALEMSVEFGAQEIPNSSLNVVRRKRAKKVPQDGAVIDVKWRVLSGKMSTDDESLQLLSKALAIFHDQFSPIIDSRSGLDFIEQMLYGKAQEFGGIYCAILTVNEMVVSAAIFRIYGKEVSELPLVATSADFQGQGCFQTLFSCIEDFLGFLNVENLLLPAADEAASIWKNKFGFRTLNEKEIHEYRKSYPIMIFQGTSFLQKSIEPLPFKPVPKSRLKSKGKSKVKG